MWFVFCGRARRSLIPSSVLFDTTGDSMDDAVQDLGMSHEGRRGKAASRSSAGGSAGGIAGAPMHFSGHVNMNFQGNFEEQDEMRELGESGGGAGTATTDTVFGPGAPSLPRGSRGPMALWLARWHM